LQWEEAQQASVLLYPEGMVKLNDSAAEILKRCDGEKKVSEVIADLQNSFPDAPDLSADVVEFLTIAIQKSWVEIVA
jgi:pyrroloquinoline quinone biosynthesis protein D